MKIAIVHDYIKEYGGAERVLEALHEVFPNAPIFTLVYLPSFLGPHRERFESASWRRKIKTSWFQYVPFKGKLISPLRILAPFLFKSFNFSRFDVVIVSQTGAYIPNAIDKKSSIQISYTHTPPRYLYGFATAREWKKNLFLRVLGEIANHFLRMIDFKSSQNVDYFVANSKNVAARIKKFYRRDATVIYPPVETNSKFKIQNSKSQSKSSKDYFLAGGRLALPKHIDLIIKTFKELKLPLKVFGRSFAGTHNLSPITHNSNIEFVGEVSDEEKEELMRNAKAFVFASEDEDFGITPVESMAVGTPVIAYRSGGVIESVVDGKTGLFFDELGIGSLKNVVLRFNKIRFDATQIIKHASKFSKERFKHEIANFVNSKFKMQSAK